MNKYWLVVYDCSNKKTWWKYFDNEKELNSFKRKINYIKNLTIIEDSRDINYI